MRVGAARRPATAPPPPTKRAMDEAAAHWTPSLANPSTTSRRGSAPNAATPGPSLKTPAPAPRITPCASSSSSSRPRAASTGWCSTARERRRPPDEAIGLCEPVRAPRPGRPAAGDAASASRCSSPSRRRAAYSGPLTILGRSLQRVSVGDFRRRMQDYGRGRRDRAGDLRQGHGAEPLTRSTATRSDRTRFRQLTVTIGMYYR